jgi:hypothetical protein
VLNYLSTMTWRRMGSGCIDPHFLQLSTSFRWVVSFMPLHFIFGERAPITHWIRGWGGPRVSLDDTEKWKFLTLLDSNSSPLSHSAFSQSLYRLRYHGSNINSMRWPESICILDIKNLKCSKTHSQDFNGASLDVTCVVTMSMAGLQNACGPRLDIVPCSYTSHKLLLVTIAFQPVQCHSLFSAHGFGIQLAIQNLPSHSKLEVPTRCIESAILTVF